MATCRSSMSKASPRLASTSGITPPANTPAATRDTSIHSKLGASAPAANESARPATHTRTQRSLPKRSPSGPRNGCAAAYGNA